MCYLNFHVYEISNSIQVVLLVLGHPPGLMFPLAGSFLSLSDILSYFKIWKQKVYFA